MNVLYLRVRARFAVFRPFVTGSYRSTAPFITPSAAYGLALNLAGIDMRRCDDGKSAMTLIADNLPRLDVALGAPADSNPWKWGRSAGDDDDTLPRVHEMYQQLHNYPVGKSQSEHAPNTKGAKYNITPVRRSFLSGLDAVVCFRHSGLEAFKEERIRAGLRGETEHRYGLPFLGDNNFLPDRIDIVESPPPCQWFVPIEAGDGETPRRGVGRLTVTIDRRDSSRTRSRLFGPARRATAAIPDGAWVRIDYSN